jgi:transposase-like protein
MKKGCHKEQELTMSELGLSLEELAGQPLELFAREGAKLLLTVALEEEVTDHLKRRPYERSQGSICGYRNGHRDRQVSCGAGEIEVAVPRRYQKDFSLSVA